VASLPIQNKKAPRGAHQLGGDSPAQLRAGRSTTQSGQQHHLLQDRRPRRSTKPPSLGAAAPTCTRSRCPDLFAAAASTATATAPAHAPSACRGPWPESRRHRTMSCAASRGKPAGLTTSMLSPEASVARSDRALSRPARPRSGPTTPRRRTPPVAGAAAPFHVRAVRRPQRRHARISGRSLKIGRKTPRRHLPRGARGFAGVPSGGDDAGR
jgi:hypothetical protein